MATMAEITYKTNCEGVDWAAMKKVLVADNFDNGRTPAQLEKSFRNSAVVAIAYAGDRIIGTARALSDGVCNAYVVDVWTETPFRRQGVARKMMQLLLEPLQGQHVFLWTDDAAAFYERIGFEPCHCIGLQTVVGEWLVNESAAQ
jgi:GNAT superfamily N-acetyltransferase